MPSMRVLDFVERNADASNLPENRSTKHECTCEGKFVTQKEFGDLKADFEALKNKYEELSLAMSEKPKTKTSKKGDVE